MSRTILASLFVAVAVAAPGFAQAPSPPAAASGSPAPVAPAPAVLPSRGQIQGSAIARRNVPIVGAVVTVQRADDPSTIRVTTTDERGAFRFDALEDGRYRCEFARDGFATVVKDDVDLRAPFRAVVEVTMAAAAAGIAPPPAPSSAPPPAPSIAPPPAPSIAPPPAIATGGAAAVALRGVVRDRKGKGSGEIRLRVTREDGTEDPRESITNARGEFAFDGLTPGRWHVEIQGAGLLPVRTTLALSRETVLAAVLVPQPDDHAPAVEDLMPPEEPVPPR